MLAERELVRIGLQRSTIHLAESISRLVMACAVRPFERSGPANTAVSAARRRRSFAAPSVLEP